MWTCNRLVQKAPSQVQVPLKKTKEPESRLISFEENDVKVGKLIDLGGVIEETNVGDTFPPTDIAKLGTEQEEGLMDESKVKVNTDGKDKADAAMKAPLQNDIAGNEITWVESKTISRLPSAEDLVFEISCVSCWGPYWPTINSKTCELGHIVCQTCLCNNDWNHCPAKVESMIEDSKDTQVACNLMIQGIHPAVFESPYYKYLRDNVIFKCGANVFGCTAEIKGHQLLEKHEREKCKFNFIRFCGHQKDGCATSFRNVQQHLIHLVKDHKVPVIEGGEARFHIRYEREEYRNPKLGELVPLIRAALIKHKTGIFLLMGEDLEDVYGKWTRLWIAGAYSSSRRPDRIYAKVLVCSDVNEGRKVDKVLLETEIAIVPTLEDVANLKQMGPVRNRRFFIDLDNKKLDEICVLAEGKKYFNLMVIISKEFVNKDTAEDERREALQAWVEEGASAVQAMKNMEVYGTERSAKGKATENLEVKEMERQERATGERVNVELKANAKLRGPKIEKSTPVKAMNGYLGGSQDLGGYWGTATENPAKRAEAALAERMKNAKELPPTKPKRVKLNLDRDDDSVNTVNKSKECVSRCVDDEDEPIEKAPEVFNYNLKHDYQAMPYSALEKIIRQLDAQAKALGTPKRSFLYSGDEDELSEEADKKEERKKIVDLATTLRGIFVTKKRQFLLYFTDLDIPEEELAI